MEGSVVWSIYRAGGKLRPARGPVLMNGLFVGLWKRAESSHPPPYGEAHTSPVDWGHGEHLPLLGCTCTGAPSASSYQLDSTDGLFFSFFFLRRNTVSIIIFYFFLETMPV